MLCSAGGTSNRQQHASCSTMNCIRLKQVMTPVPKPAVVDKATAAPTTGCKAVHALAEASGSSQPSRKRVASLDPARSAATAPAVVPGDQAARPAAAAVKAAASAPAAISAKKATAAAQPAEVTHQGMIGKPPAVEALTPPLSSTWAKVPVCHATPAIFPGPAAATGGQGPVPAPAMAVNDLIPGYDFSAYCCQEPLSGEYATWLLACVACQLTMPFCRACNGPWDYSGPRVDADPPCSHSAAAARASP